MPVNLMQLAGNSQIRHVISAQLVATFVIALGLLFYDRQFAWSGLIGGLITVSVNGLAARKVFVSYRAQNPAEVLARMKGAEVQRLLLTGILFAMAFDTLPNVSVSVLLGTYLLIQVVVPTIVMFFEDRLKTRY
ncbi:MAG: ATP synthase subunit I [Pseudomonadota bacterium]